MRRPIELAIGFWVTTLSFAAYLAAALYAATLLIGHRRAIVRAG